MAHNTLQITNMDGRLFNIRLIRINQRYGNKAEQLHTGRTPLLEFFDATEPDENAEHELGYFTGIRCETEVLLGYSETIGDLTDRLFNEDFPMWGITDDNVEEIRSWLENILNDREKTPTDLQKTPQTTQIEIITAPVITDNADTTQQLQQILTLLDATETSDDLRHSEYIDVRLNLLKSKKYVLKALQLLNSNT